MHVYYRLLAKQQFVGCSSSRIFIANYVNLLLYYVLLKLSVYLRFYSDCHPYFYGNEFSLIIKCLLPQCTLTMSPIHSYISISYVYLQAYEYGVFKISWT